MPILPSCWILMLRTPMTRIPATMPIITSAKITLPTADSSSTTACPAADLITTLTLRVCRPLYLIMSTPCNIPATIRALQARGACAIVLAQYPRRGHAGTRTGTEAGVSELGSVERTIEQELAQRNRALRALNDLAAR